MSGFIRQIQSSDGEPISPPSGIGGGGSGTGAKNYVLNPDGTDGVADITVSGGVAVAQTTTIADLPEETKGNGIEVTQTGGSGGDTAIWDTNPIDEGDKNTIGSPEMYYKTKSGYVDGDCKIYWKNTDTGETFDEFTINEGAGRISLANTSITLTEAENIKPHIEFNVANSNGIVVSGVGTLAETRLVGASIGEWKTWTPTFEGLTVNAENSFYREVGDSVEVNVEVVTASVSGGVDMSCNLPNNWNIDTGKLLDSIVGDAACDNTTTELNTNIVVRVKTATSTQKVFFGAKGGSAGDSLLDTITSTQIMTSTDTIKFQFTVPIVELAGGTVMLGTEAQGQNFRAIADSTSTTINTGIQTLVWDSFEEGENKFINGNTEVEIEVDGTYEVKASTDDVNNLNFWAIYVNDSTILNNQFSSDKGFANITRVFSAGDRIEVQASVSSGSDSPLRPRFSVTRVQDRTASATGFPISDNATEDKQYLVPDYREYTLSLVNDGANNMNGTITFVKVGKAVNFSSQSTITHNSTGDTTSASAIPEGFRPISSSVDNCFIYFNTSGQTIRINTNGTVRIFYYDETGLVNSTSTLGSLCGSYVIA